jgi:uncharacterized protein (TIGR02246 family)
MTSDERAIAAVLTDYQAAFGRSDADAVAALFTADGVLMAQGSPSVVGVNAVREAYLAMLDSIGVEIRFAIAETRAPALEWAFARTTSSGTIKIKANDTLIPEANQELFIFQKIDGNWKIARYCFSTTLPVRA